MRFVPLLLAACLVAPVAIAGEAEDIAAAARALSDPDAKVSTTYGSVMEYEGKKLSARNTFLIDPSGKIVKVYTGVKPATHSAEVLEALASLSKKS